MSRAKQVAGEKALDWVETGMTLGLGTGSTAAYFLDALGAKVRQGLDVKGVATSERTEVHARSLGIPLLSVEDVGRLDLVVDGTDEFDPHLQLIKGGGGALFREKVVAMQGDMFVVITDASKRSPVLGSFPLPLEVVPFGLNHTCDRVMALGGQAQMRMLSTYTPYRTDNGNLILDCDFGEISDPVALHSQLKALTGVVETGLFIDLATHLIIGYEDGRTEVQTRT